MTVQCRSAVQVQCCPTYTVAIAIAIYYIASYLAFTELASSTLELNLIKLYFGKLLVKALQSPT